MKITHLSKTALLCASLLGLAMPCLANEISESKSSEQLFLQPEAIVLRIDKNKVTLQDLGDKDNKIIAQFSNSNEFKIGDKVILVGNTLKKVSYNTTSDPVSNNL